MHRNSFFDEIENALIRVLLEHLSDQVTALSLIEVGAYDGRTCSHTHKLAKERGWHGLVIEPAPDAFAALRETYRDYPAITPVNCAVANEEGVLPFFCVQNTSATSWEAMLSSLDRETILRQRSIIPDVAERIVEVRVPVRKLSSLCREYELNRVDLVKIDAEGCDDQAILSINFDEIRPSIILMEHKFVSNDRLFAMDAKLTRSVGYKRLTLWANTMYVGNDFADDDAVDQLIHSAAGLFPPVRDPLWGNGNWLANPYGQRLLKLLPTSLSRWVK
jgi:FkbM family methyltransferase